MRGRLGLCLLVAAMLLPVAAADHKDRGPLIDIDLDGRGKDKHDKDKERDKEDERDEDERDEEERDEEEEREDEGDAVTGGSRVAERSAAGCIGASGGATRNGNVVSWQARQEPVEVHRRSGDGSWHRVHTAEPAQELFVDHDLRKGRAYTYAVTRAGGDPGVCPTVEMTAVPFAGALALAASAAVSLGGYLWFRRG